MEHLTETEGMRRSEKPLPRNIESVPVDVLYELGRELPTLFRCLFYESYMAAGRVNEVIPSLRQSRSLYTSGQNQYYVMQLLNEKNRQTKLKSPIGFCSNPVECEMINFVWKRIKDYPPEKPLYPGISRFEAFRRFKRLKVTTTAILDKEQIRYTFGIFPHYLRHCRVTHLVRDYGMSETDVMHFAGWTDLRPIGTYSSSNWQDFAKADQ